MLFQHIDGLFRQFFHSLSQQHHSFIKRPSNAQSLQYTSSNSSVQTLFLFITSLSPELTVPCTQKWKLMETSYLNSDNFPYRKNSPSLYNCLFNCNYTSPLRKSVSRSVLVNYFSIHGSHVLLAGNIILLKCKTIHPSTIIMPCSTQNFRPNTAQKTDFHHC